MNASILAIESGGATASVALIDAKGRLRFTLAASGQSHSSQLLPLAQSLLSDAGLGWADVDGIAVCTGPGSFTGLRIACAVAQGLALGADKKILGISAFEAWSYAWWRSQQPSGQEDPINQDPINQDPRAHAVQARAAERAERAEREIKVSFDARLGERFYASLLVSEQDGTLQMQWIETPAVLAQELVDDKTLPIKKNDHPLSDIVLRDPHQDSFTPSLPLAAWMARLACDPACASQRQWVAARDLRPLYVRDKVAQTIAERENSSDLQCMPMTERDIASVMVIENQAYPFPWTSGNFLDSLKAGYDMQVLKERGVMIGYVVWMRVMKEAHLLNITLSPARQGHGLGAWLMRQFIARLAALDIDDVLLEVRQSNQKAQALYRKFGFQTIGSRKGYYPNNADPESSKTAAREDAMVMRLALRQHGSLDTGAQALATGTQGHG